MKIVKVSRFFNDFWRFVPGNPRETERDRGIQRETERDRERQRETERDRKVREN